MDSVAALDWFSFGLYLLILIVISIWAYLKTKSSADYFMGNRQFGTVLMIAQAFGIGTNINQPVAVTGAAYSNGLSGIWYQWLWLFITPFFWIIAPIYRRLRYITMADFFKERYGAKLGLYYTFFGILYFCINIGVLLKGAGLTFEIIFQGAIREDIFIFIAPIVFMLIGLLGGLIGTVISDLLQGIFLMFFTLLLVIIGIRNTGGFSELHEILPESMFNIVAPDEITFYFIIMVVINGLIGIVALPHHMAIGGAGKSENACRIGWTFGNLFKRFASMGWAFIGIIVAVRYSRLVGVEREQAFGLAVRIFLPAGLVGLFTAVLMAATMSTFNGFMIHSSALITQNIYRDYFRPAANEREMLLVGRLSSIVTVLAGVSFACFLGSVIDGIVQIWKLMAYIGLAFWFGILWKRTNRYGVWSSTLVMIFLSLFSEFYLNWTLPNQIVLYLAAGIVTIYLVSRMTRPEPAELLQKFYTLLHTPVGQESELERLGIEIKLKGVSDKQVPANKCHWLVRLLRLNEYPSDGLVLVELPEFFRKFSWSRYRTDILGFTSAVIIVAAMVLGMLILSYIGA